MQRSPMRTPCARVTLLCNRQSPTDAGRMLDHAARTDHAVGADTDRVFDHRVGTDSYTVARFAAVSATCAEGWTPAGSAGGSSSSARIAPTKVEMWSLDDSSKALSPALIRQPGFWQDNHAAAGTAGNARQLFLARARNTGHQDFVPSACRTDTHRIRISPSPRNSISSAAASC